MDGCVWGVTAIEFVLAHEVANTLGFPAHERQLNVPAKKFAMPRAEEMGHNSRVHMITRASTMFRTLAKIPSTTLTRKLVPLLPSGSNQVMGYFPHSICQDLRPIDSPLSTTWAL